MSDEEDDDPFESIEGRSEIYDSLSVERILFDLTEQEVIILLYKFLGYKPDEIRRKLGFKNTQHYYYNLCILRKKFKENIESQL